MPTPPTRRRAAPCRAAGALALALLACLAPGAARAQWPATSVGLPVCVQPGIQNYRVAISDGAGGLFTAWADYRFVISDIYAQHVSATGHVLWRTDGVLVCAAAGRQEQPALASDGAGGIVVAWRDYRTDLDGDIYAQRLDAGGSPMWVSNGVPVCTAAGAQFPPVLAPDTTGGACGAVIAWEDDRAEPRIYAQRVDSSGVTRWGADGVPASTSLAAEFQPSIVSAGDRGTILAWSQQGVADFDVFAQNLDGAGQPLWAPDGQPVCTATGDQYGPIAVSDSLGGAWVVWQGDRSSSIGVYAQHVTLLGMRVIEGDGIGVCDVNADQLAPAAAADTRGGLVVAWQDARVNADIYAQRLDPAGARRWAATGQPVCASAGTHAFPSVAADGWGGALVAWEDDRGNGLDIYAQRVDSAGVSRWTANGEAECTTTGSQFLATIVSSPDTSGVVLWEDLRTANDLYCQRAPLAVADIAAPVAFRSGPNPATESASFTFALASAGRAEIVIFDAQGRRVRTLAHQQLGAGDERLAWDARDDAGRRCPGGVYFARLSLDGRALATHSLTLCR